MHRVAAMTNVVFPVLWPGEHDEHHNHNSNILLLHLICFVARTRRDEDEDRDVYLAQVSKTIDAFGRLSSVLCNTMEDVVCFAELISEDLAEEELLAEDLPNYRSLYLASSLFVPALLERQP